MEYPETMPSRVRMCECMVSKSEAPRMNQQRQSMKIFSSFRPFNSSEDAIIDVQGSTEAAAAGDCK